MGPLGGRRGQLGSLGRGERFGWWRSVAVAGGPHLEQVIGRVLLKEDGRDGDGSPRKPQIKIEREVARRPKIERTVHVLVECHRRPNHEDGRRVEVVVGDLLRAEAEAARSILIDAPPILRGMMFALELRSDRRVEPVPKGGAPAKRGRAGLRTGCGWRYGRGYGWPYGWGNRLGVRAGDAGGAAVEGHRWELQCELRGGTTGRGGGRARVRRRGRWGSGVQ